MKEGWHIFRLKDYLTQEENQPKLPSRNSEIKDYDKICFTSMILIDPGLFIFFFYYLTGIILNIPLTYFILDIVIVIGWHISEKRRAAEYAQYEGDRTEIIRQKIEELKEIEREMKAKNANQ